MSPADLSARPWIVGQAHLGGGPAWFPAERRLRWVDVLGGRVHGARLDGSDLSTREFPHAVSAVVPRVGGGLVVAGDGGVLLLDADGCVESTHPVEADLPGNRLGDVGVDPAGRLWLGTLDRDLLVGRGALYRLDPDGTLTQVLSRTSVSNGIGWSPDGTRMYYVDGATWRIDVLDYDVAAGQARHRRPWVRIDHADGSPDGLAVDEDGGVWVALWGGGQVRRYDPAGRLDVVVPLPVRQVTGCCFGGPDLDRLFVTTARVEMDERRLLLEPLAGSVFVASPGHRGVPPPAFGG